MRNKEWKELLFRKTSSVFPYVPHMFQTVCVEKVKYVFLTQ